MKTTAKQLAISIAIVFTTALIFKAASTKDDKSKDATAPTNIASVTSSIQKGTTTKTNMPEPLRSNQNGADVDMAKKKFVDTDTGYDKKWQELDEQLVAKAAEV